MRRITGSALISLLALVAALWAPLSPSGAAPAAPPGSKTSPNGQAHRAAQATAALARVQAMLEGRGGDQTGRGVTLALRDLALLRDALSPTQKRAAHGLVARPTDGAVPIGTGYTVPEATPVCGPNICVHYVASTEDAPDLADTSPADGIPDWVALNLATLESVHTTYVAAGYKPPKADGTLGGNAKMDVYLSQIGDDGVYGYCAPEQDLGPGAWDSYSYCVVDDDFAATEFPTNTPAGNLQVTAAHEYFHAVQFAYDAAEDHWFMEATATWAEDELYDDINDNLQYLSQSPISHPRVPLDTFAGLHQYGEWIFFRFLTEQLPTEEGGLPTLVRDMWRRADAVVGAPDDYSMQAVRKVVEARGLNWRLNLGVFAGANVHPASFYEEGASYPVAPLKGRRTFTPAKPKWGTQAVSLDHLTTATYRLTPQGLGAKGWKLQLSLDMAPVATGSSVVFLQVNADGSAAWKTATLNGLGDATVRIPFSSSKVRYIEMTLANTSTRYTCWTGGAFSCVGFAKDEGKRQSFSARLVK